MLNQYECAIRNYHLKIHFECCRYIPTSKVYFCVINVNRVGLQIRIIIKNKNFQKTKIINKVNADKVCRDFRLL